MIISTNKKAYFDFELSDFAVAGIELLGTEVKSIKNHNCNLSGSYVFVNSNEELELVGFFVSEYKQAFKDMNHNPMRTKKLLMKKKEIRKLHGATSIKNYTIVPTKIFVTNNGIIKVEIALAKGKKLHDKREDIKQKDLHRDMLRKRKNLHF